MYRVVTSVESWLAKVRPFTLPDPLVLADGAPVRDAKTWQERRRPELLRLYETEIYGRIPADAPRVTWRVADTDAHARDGAAILNHLEGTIGNAAGAPVINVKLYTPARARGPVPVILLVNFGGGDAPAPGGAGAPPPSSDPPVASEIIAKGWGYATVGYQDIQPDRADPWTSGVIGVTLAANPKRPTQPAPDEWGTISAWSWGVSRIIDYLERDPSVNVKQIALFGHSRLGKTALWASALDTRIAAVYSSCAGEMGSALARRDWGETVDDMAQNFAWQFAGNF